MRDIERFSDGGLEALENSGFLESADFAFLQEAKDELQDGWEKRQIWRTETEIRFSVLNDLDHPTKAAKYWQAIREQAVFFQELVKLSFEYQRLLIDLEETGEKMQTADGYELRRLDIDRQEMLYKKRNMEIAARDRVRELRLWSKIKAELDDGSFNNRDVNAHQAESYRLRFAQQLPSTTDEREKAKILVRLNALERMGKNESGKIAFSDPSVISFSEIGEYSNANK